MIYDRDSACTLYNGMPCVCLVLPAPKMRRSLNSPFLVQRYILEELSVAPSIPVISYIKVSDASFTKFSLIPPSAHTVCQKSKLCSLISHHLAQHCITPHHIALLYTTSHPTAPHTASTSHCTATHGKVCRICTIVTTVC